MLEMKLIQYKSIQIYVFPSPTNNNSNEYASQLYENGIKNIIHFNQLEYNTDVFIKQKIQFYNLSFADGGTPSSEQLLDWLSLIETFFGSPSTKGMEVTSLPTPNVKNTRETIRSEPQNNPHITQDVTLLSDSIPIAVHCKASLGRAPLMITIALIYFGMDEFDAIEYIRKQIPGSLNSKQLKYLESNHTQIKKSGKSNKKSKGCIVS